MDKSTLELEAIKMEAFAAGYKSALQNVAMQMENEKKAKEKANEPVKNSK